MYAYTDIDKDILHYIKIHTALHTCMHTQT